MTTNDTPPPQGTHPAGAAGDAPPPPPAGDGFFDSVRRIGVTRSDDRWIGGVAAGVADRFGLDPLLVRGLLILSVFVAGAGLVLYGIAWALLPERSDGRIHLQETVRGTFDVAIVGAGLAVLLGLVGGGGFWPWWGGPAEWVAALFWIAFWVAVVWLIVKLVRSRRSDARPGPAPGAPGAAPTAAPTVEHTSDPSTGWDPATHAAEGFTPAPRVHYAPAPTTTPGATPSSPGPAAPTAHTAPTGGYAPPPPPGPRPRRAAGGGTVGVVLGIVLLLGAGLLAADVAGGLAWPLWPLWLAIAVAVLGAAIVVTGLRGLRGGWLTALAWLGIVAVAVTWPFADRDDDWPFDGWSWDDRAQITTQAGTVLGSGEVAPRSTEAAEAGYRLQFGDSRVDLTELDLDDVPPGNPVVVPVDATAGNAVVTIPEDTAVEAVVDVNAGTFEWFVDDEHLRVDGFTGGPATYTTDEVDELGGAVLRLDVDSRAGRLVIQEER
ncbi:hypothetical protein GCM10023216_30960 [Isoptericola chiayiensis]|uniref:Phage shock protein PspC N-terminal domain-containing protein n=1 Tax=Isoptericola chiayiensis TaxID=579446 RepID=A0ABP8YP07_9MICO|nr:PspC domain-containing protein [Isoptericola chiayiensis]NOW01672.1 phage shock protein PspC (stress-responsive transcriptional regulator) [Isoptericola chiayiensis]